MVPPLYTYRWDGRLLLAVWAGDGQSWLEFRLAGERAERLEVGPDATSWRTRVAAGERRPSEFQPRHWPGL